MPPDLKLRRRLGLKQGQRLAMVNMPYWFLCYMGLINNTVLGGKDLPNPDYVQIFAETEEDFEESLDAVMRNFKPGAIFWICHPDSSGGFSLNSGHAAELLSDCGLEKIKELPLPNGWLATRFREVSAGNSVVN